MGCAQRRSAHLHRAAEIRLTGRRKGIDKIREALEGQLPLLSKRSEMAESDLPELTYVITGRKAGKKLILITDHIKYFAESI